MDRIKYYLIIGGLILFIVILSMVINSFRSQPSENGENITPTQPLGPTITPVQINYVFPTLAPALQQELIYPIEYDNMTIEYKPRSGTFLMYYRGDISTATTTGNRFFAEENIDPNSYRVEYRSLEPVTLPPRVEIEVP